MPTTFDWDVRLDGSNIATLIPETGRIDYGRASVWEQPQLPVAVIDLITVDNPAHVAGAWPEFSLGEHSMPSGFVDTYTDTYGGPASRLTLGSPLAITAVTPSGFVDTYSDEYAGIDLPRFTGFVQAMDYTPEIVRVTALVPQEAWARIEVGGTDDTTPIPAESDVDRVDRLCTEAGVAITIHGTTGPDLTAIPVNTVPSGLLDQLQAIARDARGLFYVDRAGDAHYRTSANLAATYLEVDAVELPSDATLLNPVAMSAELGTVATRVVVEYGDPDVDTNVRPTVEAVDEDLRVLLFGDDGPHRTVRRTVQLDVEADAQDYADALLAALAPAWSMPNATVALSDATGPQIVAVAGLEQGVWVAIPTLLAGSPVTTYSSPALGYTEALSTNDWQITHHLAPSALPIPVRT